MLATLAIGQSIAANSTQTWTYSCQSLQKVLIGFDDDSGTDAYDASVNVQIGSRTIVNTVKSWGLWGVTSLQSDPQGSNADFQIGIDLGSHQCGPNESVYITVTSTDAISTHDVAIICNEPMAGDIPLKYTVYDDTTFSAENVMLAINYIQDTSAVQNDNYTCEIRTPTYASSPNFISANTNYQSVAKSSTNAAGFGLLSKNSIPMDTTFNYSSSAATDRILCVQALGTTKYGQVKANLAEKQAVMENRKISVVK